MPGWNPRRTEFLVCTYCCTKKPWTREQFPHHVYAVCADCYEQWMERR